jgi:hypothetical protein
LENELTTKHKLVEDWCGRGVGRHKLLGELQPRRRNQQQSTFYFADFPQIMALSRRRDTERQCPCSNKPFSSEMERNGAHRTARACSPECRSRLAPQVRIFSSPPAVRAAGSYHVAGSPHWRGHGDGQAAESPLPQPVHLHPHLLRIEPPR